MGQFQAAVLALSGSWIVTVDDSPFNRSLWAGFDVLHLVSRNGVGNQGKSPGRTFGEMVIYSPGLRTMPQHAAAA